MKRKVVSMLIVISLLFGMIPMGVLANDKQTDAAIAYFVDAGDQNPLTVNAGDKLGVYNSVTDQDYGPDPITGKLWGVNGAQTEATALSEYVDGMDKKQSFRCGRTDRNVIYKFELPAGIYEIEIGIPHYPNYGSPRVVDITVTNGDSTKRIATGINTLNIPQNEVEVVNAEFMAPGTEVTLEFSKNQNGNWDPIVSYIIIRKGDVEAALSDFRDFISKAKRYSSADYTTESYQALQNAVQAAEAAVNGSYNTAMSVYAERAKLEEAIANLRGINDYLVSFANGGGGGSLPEESYQESGTTFKLPESNLTKENHTFAGWNDGTTTYPAGADYLMPDSAVVFTAQWAADRYTISFTDGGGTGDLPADMVGELGETITLPECSLRRDGYVFAGWLHGPKLYAAGDTYVMPPSDVTFKAQWTATDTYRIVFRAGGGAGALPDEMTGEAGSAMTLPGCALTRTGCIFSGWNDGTAIYQPGTVYTMPAETVTLTAEWMVTPQQSYFVRFDSSGGTSVMQQVIRAGGRVIRPDDPARTGYMFTGWKSGSEYYDFTKAVTRDITLTAEWKKVSVPRSAISKITSKKRGQVVVRMKKVTGAKGYHIVYSSDKRIKKSKRQVTVSTIKSTIKKLKKHRTYYFKVRAYKMDSTDKKVYGRYSKVRKIRVK